MTKPVDLTNQRFGMLTAIRFSGERDNSGNRLWECSCDCGGTTLATVSNLRSGSVNNCGCKHGNRKHFKRCPPDETCVSCRGDHCDGLLEMFCVTRGKCKLYTTK